MTDRFTFNTGPHDWPEDEKHENGSYMNRCCRCFTTFIGHKRRNTCRLCATAPVEMSDEQIRARFRLHHGGPNPYYACVHCDEVEPGLREYLVRHMSECAGAPNQGIQS